MAIQEIQRFKGSKVQGFKSSKREFARGSWQKNWLLVTGYWSLEKLKVQSKNTFVILNSSFKKESWQRAKGSWQKNWFLVTGHW
jgi:hypothetical protein